MVSKNAGKGDAAHDTTAPVTPEELNRRLEDAQRLAGMHGLLCTGSHEQPECGNPSVVGIVLHGALYALPCIDHAPQLGAYIIRQGHGAFRQAPLVDLIDVHGADAIVKACGIIRAHNARAGIALPLGRYHKGKR